MYNYYEEMKQQLKTYYEGNKNQLEYLQHVNFNDAVEILKNHLINQDFTGNQSGTFFKTSDEAKRAVEDNLEIAGNALVDFGYDSDYYTLENLTKKDSWLFLDVLIRNELLHDIVYDFIYDLQGERK